MSRKAVMRILICAAIGAVLGFAATASDRISGVTVPFALAAASLILLICVTNLVLRSVLKDRGIRMVLTYYLKLGSRWTPLSSDETLTEWRELAEMRPLGAVIRGWRTSSGMVWLECIAEDSLPFTVISRLPTALRSGWIAGPIFWQSRSDQPAHRLKLPFQLFQPLDHPWTRVGESDSRWNWIAEARTRGATEDIVAWHCRECGGVRFDCLKDGKATHVVARDAGDEHVIRRAFGLFFVYYGPELYPSEAVLTTQPVT